MFKRKTKPESTLQTSIDNTLSELEKFDADSPEYDKILNQLERLYKLQTREAEKKTVSPDVWVNASVSLLGILLILNHERLNVVTTKAFQFIRKV